MLIHLLIQIKVDNLRGNLKKNNMTADKQIIIRITPAKKAAFKSYADSVNKSVSELLMQFIDSCLEDQQPDEFVRIADFRKLKTEFDQFRQQLLGESVA